MHETRMNLPDYFIKRFQYQSSLWTRETVANSQILAMSSPQSYTEKILDANKMNWYIQSTDIFFPKIKKIMIDERDEDLFR